MPRNVGTRCPRRRDVTPPWPEILSLTLLAAVLIFAMVQPRGLPEATLAVPAAAALLLTGAISWAEAVHEVLLLAPTVGFLAAILVLARLADVLGVFSWLGTVLGRSSRHRPQRLLALVFVAASVTTAVLSLDATVVLLTPVVIGSARLAGVRSGPHVYACAHLSNTASTLLPVSNLTNLLAFSACGLSFASFASVMALPWLVSILIEYGIFRLFFRRDLAGSEPLPEDEDDGAVPDAPLFAFAVIGATLVGFGVSGWLGVEPVWIAVAGAAVLAVPALAGRSITPRAIVASASPLFCVFVLALSVVVAAVSTNGLGDAIEAVVPASTSLLGLVAMAALAAVLANVVNNLPATLILLAALGTTAPPGLILAMLLGVNIGPNLTYVGSLATLLWRRVLNASGQPPHLGRFTALGAVTVPIGLLGAVGALWLGLRVGLGQN